MAALLNKHAFGLHITDAVIKLAELAPQGNSYKLIAYSERKLPPNVVADGAINDLAILAREVRQLIDKPVMGRVTTPYVVLSLPELRVFLKTINLPHFPEKQLTEAILWEARSVLPIPPDHAYYQTQILSRTKEQIEALCGATEKNLVDRYLELMQLVYLTPIAFDMECYATTRTIDPSEIANHVVLQVHVGSNVTMLSVLKRGQVWFSHALPTGIAMLASEMANPQNISMGMGPTKEVIPHDAGIDKTFQTLATGIASTIHFYEQQSTSVQQHIETILLTGAYSQMPGLVERIQHDLASLPVRVAKPRLTFPPTPGLAPTFSPLQISIGLALRGAYPAQWQADLNFLPDQFLGELEVRDLQLKNIFLLKALAFVAGIVVIVLIFFLWRLFRENAAIEQSIAQQNALVNAHPAKNFFPWVDAVNRDLKLFTDLESLHFPAAALVKKVSGAVPQGVVLKSLLILDGGKKVELTGIGISRAHVLALSEKLKGDKSVSNVNVPLGSFNQDHEVEFKLEFSLDPSQL